LLRDDQPSFTQSPQRILGGGRTQFTACRDEGTVVPFESADDPLAADALSRPDDVRTFGHDPVPEFDPIAEFSNLHQDDPLIWVSSLDLQYVSDQVTESPATSDSRAKRLISATCRI
jgi:hypothetical protein